MKKNLIFFLIFFFLLISLFSSCSITTIAAVKDKTDNIAGKTSPDDAGNADGTLSTAEPGEEGEQTSGSIVSENNTKEIISFSPEEMKEMIENKKGDYFLIDVRTPEEFAEGYIESANLIPISDIESRIDEIPKDKKIIVYCKSGGRSRNAAEILVNNGFPKVYDLGGITDWLNKGYEIVLPSPSA